MCGPGSLKFPFLLVKSITLAIRAARCVYHFRKHFGQRVELEVCEIARRRVFRRPRTPLLRPGPLLAGWHEPDPLITTTRLLREDHVLRCGTEKKVPTDECGWWSLLAQSLYQLQPLRLGIQISIALHLLQLILVRFQLRPALP
jgi:hypothetical protein